MTSERKNGTGSKSGVSRRDFIGRVGSGTVGAALGGAAIKPQATSASQSDSLPQMTLVVNGRSERLSVEPRWTLLDVLRDRLGLMGTKLGCGRGECGACTVLIDGLPRYACMTLALETEGHQVTTVVGLMDGEELGPVQRAFVEEDAFQCGYCTPGQVVAAEGLLRENPHPNESEVRAGMSGNLCRCGAYKHIMNAVRRAADTGR